MKILLIEDDLIWQHKIKILLEEIGYSKIKVCERQESVLEAMESFMPDLIISDIYMGRSNIFDIFDYNAPNIPILFITTSEEESLYAKSQKICNTLYLIKPFHKITLQSAIDTLLKELKVKRELDRERYITVRGTGNEKIILRADQIVFIISELNYCVIKTPKNQFALKSSLEKIQSSLGDDIIRIHKSYLVNRSYILKVDLAHKMIKTPLGAIPVGRQYKSNVLTYLDSVREI